MDGVDSFNPPATVSAQTWYCGLQTEEKKQEQRALTSQLSYQNGDCISRSGYEAGPTDTEKYTSPQGERRSPAGKAGG